MKKIALFGLILPLLAGCFSSRPSPTVGWLLEVSEDIGVNSVIVRPPYDGNRLTVLRSDGSVAFDAYNEFAAKPSSLIKAAILDPAAKRSLVVSRFALDCSDGVNRVARVELRLVGENGEKTFGRCDVAVASGNLGAAFSAAFNAALKAAAKGR